jgi:hypothetical protein
MKNNSNDGMKYNNVITLLVVAIIVVAVVNTSVTMLKLANINQMITGYATQTGYVNITVNSVVALNISRNVIFWGPGIFNASSCAQVNLTTIADASSVLPAGCGNWSGANAKSIIFSNIGNLNVSIALQSNASAHDLFGAAIVTEELYMWNLSNREANACGWSNKTAYNLSNFYNVSEGTQVTICNQLGYTNTVNTMQIDVRLGVPESLDVNKFNVQQMSYITIYGNGAVAAYQP